MSEAAPKKESGEPKKADVEENEGELQRKRAQQLRDYQSAVASLGKQLQAAKTNLRTCEVLSDHSDGFYQEISKLTKGKLAIPATPLVRQTANDIIRDAKSLVTKKADVHLDRIKEFVPAGDEPTYPDVLITIRSVNDGLKRHSQRLKSYIETLQARLSMASTVVGALNYVSNDEEADEDSKNTPPKESVAAYTRGTVSSACLTRFSNSYTEYYFDFDKLDSMTLQEYLSTAEDDDTDDEDVEPSLDDDEQSEEEGEEDGHVE